MDEFDAWAQCPPSIARVIREADPALETVKYEEFAEMDFRVFGIMPDSENFLLMARDKAQELGYTPMILTRILQAEARESAKAFCAIACNATEYGEPAKAPLALLSSGEMVVTVDKHKGIGGRNQEFSLCAAMRIANYRNITVGSADTDGTDGPGGLRLDGAPHCLGGGIVDGYTMDEAAARGVDVLTALNTHNTSEALWKLGCGMHLTQNISLNDLTVILVGADGGPS
jgi:glycerate-2-kinase